MSHILTLAEVLANQAALKKRFHQEFPDLKKVSTQRVVRVQSSVELTKEEIVQVHQLILDSVGEKVSHHGAHVYEVSFQPAVLDPEHTAIEKMITSLEFGEKIEAVKLSTVYVFEGLKEEDASKLVHKYLFNELLHVILSDDYQPESLRIQAKAEPTQIITGFREMNLRELKNLSEERSLYMEDHFLLEVQRKFKENLERDPTDAEIEYLAQRTSDHCFHTTWKSLGLFKKLKAEVDKVLPVRPDIVSVFVDNSGVMAVDSPDDSPLAKGEGERSEQGVKKGMTYLIKGETHNSPTAIAPVGGVETMHGGCIRDIMGTGQGGYPTMATQVFIIGDQSKEEMSKDYDVDHFLDPLVILRGMIQGVQNYGNPMGIPNFGGRVFRHPQFFGKPLALGICLGKGERQYAKIGTPEPGDIALLIGNPTGRDGIHGATMSSAASSGEMVKKEGAAVQIGDPYTERLIMEATPLLSPHVRAYGDLGAGGIASCFGEMAEGVGIEMDLTNIPTKYEGLSPWEKLESEAQERMGLAVPPENMDKVKEILDLHEVPYHELGKFTGNERLIVKHGDETIVDLDYEWLEQFPIPQKKLDQFIPHTKEINLSDHMGTDHDATIRDSLMSVLKNPDLSDQSMFFRRWDSTVQGISMRESCAPFTNMPYDQGITVPDPKTGKTQVLSLTVNPNWTGNPYNMARACFIGTVSKQIAAGVKRNKIAMCDNFYTPKSRPEIDWHLTEMVRGINELMVDLGTPMISGKDSSSGTTKLVKKNHLETSVPDGLHHSDEQKEHVENFEITPTLCMSAMGAGEDFRKVPPKEFQSVGNKLFLISAGVSNDASGSILLDEETRNSFLNFEINIQEYTKTIDKLSELIDSGNIKSISVLDDGGIFHRLFEMMLGSNLGVDLKALFVGSGSSPFKGSGVEEASNSNEFLEFLTKIIPGSFIIEVENETALEGVDNIHLGEIIKNPDLIIGEEVLELTEMKKAWQQTWYDILQLPKEQKNIPVPENILPFSPSKITKRKVNVVYSAGINCHQEMVRAWNNLGCDTTLISVTDPNVVFADADIVVFPGGFADGDYLGAAKVWHRIMETQFKDQMDFLRSGKIPVLGICNGFQLMTRSGFFGDNLKLTFNNSATFEQRWVSLKFTKESANSIWCKGLEGQQITVPVAHGEGKFVVDGKMDQATVSLQYAPDQYPNNPNGSAQAIAGVFAGDRGQFWGGMPHPERAIEEFHFSQHGMVFFENLLKNLED